MKTKEGGKQRAEEFRSLLFSCIWRSVKSSNSEKSIMFLAPTLLLVATMQQGKIKCEGNDDFRRICGFPN